MHVDDWADQLQAGLSAAAQHGVAVTLDGAPIASWVLARLAKLSRSEPPALELAGEPLAPDGPVEIVDDAVFVLDWRVVDAEGVTRAKLQIQGGMVGVGLLGVQDRDLGPRLVEALTEALLTSPADVDTVCARVQDPDWMNTPQDYVPAPSAEHVNHYGWDGTRYLGTQNVRPA